MTFSASISISGFGYRVADLIDYTERVLSDEKKRKILEQQIGVSFPNPCKDYVKLCVDALKDKDPTAVRLLKILDEKGGFTFDRLLEESKEQGLEIADKNQLFEHLSKLARLLP